MFDALSLPFMQRAIAGGLLVSLVAGYFGPFVVQRRLAFLGSGLAHAAFGGVALGLLLNVEPLWVAMPFTAAVAIGIVWLRDQAGLASDTTIGIFFSISMALGIVFLALRDTYSADAFTFLFGSLLAIDRADLWIAAGMLALTAATLPLWGRWAYATFDPSLARADRVRVLRDDYLLAVAIACATVVAIKIVGIVLIAAFLVMPAACARVFSRTFAGMTLLSLAISAATLLVGLFASYYADLPSGPAIILTQAILLAVGLVARRKN
jgi:zinc transport system permease protein